MDQSSLLCTCTVLLSLAVLMSTFLEDVQSFHSILPGCNVENFIVDGFRLLPVFHIITIR